MEYKGIPFDITALRQKVFHLYQEMFVPLLKSSQITQMEADILLFLANNPGHDTAAEIVSMRQLTKSHVSSSVEQLVQKGFLTRVYDEGNRKKIHLKLLAPAEPLVASGRKIQERFFSTLTEGIPAEDLAVSSRVLDKILDNIAHYKGGNSTCL